MWSKISEGWHAKSYLWARLKSLSKRKLEVSVLDATAIGVSILRGDVSTASSVMFLLGIGVILCSTNTKYHVMRVNYTAVKQSAATIGGGIPLLPQYMLRVVWSWI